MKKQKIKVTRVPVQTDPPTEIFQIEIIAAEGNGMWCEVLNTEEQLRLFLRGLRVATAMGGETFDMASVWEFDKDSCVKELP